jgi:hypothetical protein
MAGLEPMINSFNIDVYQLICIPIRCSQRSNPSMAILAPKQVFATAEGWTCAYLMQKAGTQSPMIAAPTRRGA